MKPYIITLALFAGILLSGLTLEQAKLRRQAVARIPFDAVSLSVPPDTPQTIREYERRVLWAAVVSSTLPQTGYNARAQLQEGTKGKVLWVTGPSVNPDFAYRYGSISAGQLRKLGFSQVVFTNDRFWPHFEVVYDVDAGQWRERKNNE